MLIRIVGVRLSHFVGILAVSLGPYALIAAVLIWSGAVTARGLAVAVVALAVVVVCAAIVFVAVEFSREAQARRRPYVRTPDTDPPVELIALCVALCVLWLGVGAFDHRSTWPPSFDHRPAEVRAEMGDR